MSVEEEQGRSVRLVIVDPSTERLLGSLSRTPYQGAYERRSADGRASFASR